MTRRRLDTLLAERGLARSRTHAAESVRAGLVRIGRGGERPTKPSQMVEEEIEIEIEGPPSFVSRGGIKLENALESLGIDVVGRDCLDVGASTGGFTDCLLKRGATRVIALDVAHGQLDWGLRNDDRVHVIERFNGRELEAGALPWAPSLITADVSFISLRKLLPAIAACLEPGGDLLGLVKPQFELGRQRVGRGGVVRDPADRREALLTVARAAVEQGLVVKGLAASGLPGPKGNLESFVWCGNDGDGVADLEAAAREVEP